MTGVVVFDVRVGLLGGRHPRRLRSSIVASGTKCFRRIPKDGVLYSQLFQGHTDGEAFEHFIEALLPHCGRFPEPKSVLVMDNASIHHTAKIQQMCDDAGVVLLYLPPYSPDLNPIEEFFAELKGFVKRHWADCENCPDFAWFLEWCVRSVGARKASAEGRFRHAGLEIEEHQ